jgi:hypothetical protein
MHAASSGMREASGMRQRTYKITLCYIASARVPGFLVAYVLLAVLLFVFFWLSKNNVLHRSPAKRPKNAWLAATPYTATVLWR